MAFCGFFFSKFQKSTPETLTFLWFFLIQSSSRCGLCNIVLSRSIRPSRVTRQVDMAEIRRLLVKKAKIHFFFEPYGQLLIIRAEFYLVRSILSLKI